MLIKNFYTLFILTVVRVGSVRYTIPVPIGNYKRVIFSVKQFTQVSWEHNPTRLKNRSRASFAYRARLLFSLSSGVFEDNSPLYKVFDLILATSIANHAFLHFRWR